MYWGNLQIIEGFDIATNATPEWSQRLGIDGDSLEWYDYVVSVGKMEVEHWLDSGHELEFPGACLVAEFNGQMESGVYFSAGINITLIPNDDGIVDVQLFVFQLGDDGQDAGSYFSAIQQDPEAYAGFKFYLAEQR